VQHDLTSAGQVLDKVDQMDFGGLSTNANVLLTQSQEAVAKLQPDLANIDFNALNQTLLNAQHATRDMEDILAQLKSYPAGFLFGNPPPEVKQVSASKK
jgi:hypothetical protein